MQNLFKNIFSDLILLYKNFIHWNISKILILVFSLWLWILLSLPFFALTFVIAYLDPIDWKDIIYNYYTTQSVWLSLMTALSSHLFYVILVWVLFLVAVWFFFFWYSYKIITLTKLNISYLDWEKIPYMKNIYFDVQKILSYLWVVAWGWLILLIPFIIFIIIFFVLIGIFWWIEEVWTMIKSNWVSNPFSITTWVFLLIWVLGFIYLAYRLTFSYIILIDDKNYKEVQKSIFYIKESFRISSWIKIFKFFLFLIIFTIIMLPFDYIWRNLEETWAYAFLYWIFVFLIINWLFEMLVLSIYKHIMLDKKASKTKEDIGKEDISSVLETPKEEKLKKVAKKATTEKEETTKKTTKKSEKV